MRNLISSTLALTLLLVAAHPAHAEFPHQSLYVGLHGGGSLVLRDWDLRGEGTLRSLTPQSSGMLGLRLGFHFLSWLAVEGELSYLPATSSSGSRNHLLSYNLDLLLHLMKTSWAPVIEAGFGGYQSVSGDLGKDTDPRAHVGIGLRGLLTPWMALRVNLRDVFSDGFDEWAGNNLELTAGLDFFVWRARRQPADRDHDGIPDLSDACPDTAGTPSAQGCPDLDDDGVADKDDRCFRQRGPAQLHGCPDRDGDRVPDPDDRCPGEAGAATLKGCPDGDGDAIADLDDRCPQQHGPAALKGCPDTDGDGIADPDDRCPQQKGPASLQGCPDRDGDGVSDVDDHCPDVPGLKDQQGCMPEAAKKFSGAIKGITFTTGSAKIARRSFPLLDEAAKLLAQHASMRLAIEGHTDNVGKPEKNQKLSQARAEAVRDYLASKGVEGTRLEAKGFGDTRPLEDNKKAKGRAANRRIEFHISAQ